MRNISVFFGILSILLLPACSTLEVTANYDPSADFSKYKTYSWETPKSPVLDSSVNNPILNKRIAVAVDTQLAAKGFKKVDSDADFLVGYHVALENKVSVTSMNNYYGYARGGWGWNYPYRGRGGVDVYEYQQGTLVLDMVDPKTNSLIWRGSAQAEVDQYAKQAKKDKLLNDAVAGMLEKFPPTKASH